jgi:hypothetical protein
MTRRFWSKLTISDILLLLLCIAGIFVSFSLTRKDSARKQVFVYKENRLWGEYPLSEDQVIRIDEHNTLEIRSGKVRMAAADCPDKRCVKMGYVQNVPIICLPNQVMVEIKAEEKERKFILH